MTERKRRQPTPHFKLPPPFQPMTGEEATLLVEGEYPYCAMLQVVEEDTHCNYVVCRGYDPRNREFFDYEEGNPDKPGIAVAKPYDRRVKGSYQIGQVFPAVLPLSAGFKDGTKTVPFIGQNPGEAEAEGDECKGHPLDLTEEITLLKDENDVYINWLLLDGGSSRDRELMLAEDHPGQSIAFKCYLGKWCPQDHTWRYNCDDGCDEWVWAIDHRYDVPYPAIGARGLFTPRTSNIYGVIWECVNLDCSSKGSCVSQDIDQPCPENDSTNYAGECT